MREQNSYSTKRKRRRRKKKSGCGCIVTAGLCFILIACILIFTDVLDTMRHRIELQLYPLGYRQEIMKASDEYNLEPEFICAVIHTESRFDPEATSPVGAKGLMQLMPETFLWLASVRGEDRTESDLLTPRINIDYGCYYLRYLADTYGDIYTAAASYNAGSVVTSWLGNPDYSSDGITLSSIPYPETEDYVEKIKTAQQMYQSLYFE